jgi:NADPH2:quinone reductase
VVEDWPEPEGESVVHVRAAGVNFMDVLVRRGDYPQPPRLPAVLGAEVAGELDGRRVIALPRSGGYAESVAAEFVVPLPDGATFAEGAAFLMTFLTAWIPLSREKPLDDRTVLVHAGAGGVGTAAIQVARFLGARVVATASTEEKRAFSRDVGAEEAYGYDEYAEVVQADVVVDPVGGEAFAASLKVLRPLGTLIAIGYAGGMWTDVNPALLVGRNITVAGFYLGRLMSFEPELVRSAAEQLVELWADGAIHPVVGAEFPLEQAADAHRLIEERRHLGKVVLVP